MGNIVQLIIACQKGGTSIEDLAEKFPDMIIKVCSYHFPNLIVTLLSIHVSCVCVILLWIYIYHLVCRCQLMSLKESQMKMLPKL